MAEFGKIATLAPSGTPTFGPIVIPEQKCKRGLAISAGTDIAIGIGIIFSELRSTPGLSSFYHRKEITDEDEKIANYHEFTIGILASKACTNE